MPEYPWLKLWNEALDDPKFPAAADMAGTTTPVALTAFLKLCTFANSDPARRQEGSFAELHPQIIASLCRVGLDVIEKLLAAYRELKMVVDQKIANWPKRQTLAPIRLATVDGVRVEDRASAKVEQKRASAREKVSRWRARKTAEAKAEQARLAAEAKAEQARLAAEAAGQGWLSELPVPWAGENKVPPLFSPSGASEQSPAAPVGNVREGFPPPEVSSEVSTPVTGVTSEAVTAVTAVTAKPETRRNPRVTSAQEKRESKNQESKREGQEDSSLVGLSLGRFAPLGRFIPFSSPAPAEAVKRRKKEARRARVKNYVLKRYAGEEQWVRIGGLQGCDTDHDAQWWFDRLDAEMVQFEAAGPPLRGEERRAG